jgi:hypothetical protein
MTTERTDCSHTWACLRREVEESKANGYSEVDIDIDTVISLLDEALAMRRVLEIIASAFGDISASDRPDFKTALSCASSAAANALGPVEPGELIAAVTCPCCGASLRVERGDDPGEVVTIGERPEAGERELDDYCAALRICTDALFDLGAIDVLNLLIPHIGTPLEPKYASEVVTETNRNRHQDVKPDDSDTAPPENRE